MATSTIHTRRIIWIVLVLFAVFVFATSFELREFVDESFLRLKNFIEEKRTLGVIIFLTLSALSAMLSPFSVIPFIPIAVLAWGEFFSIAVMLMGWLLGASISFFLARNVGRPVLKKYISFEHIDHYLEKLPSHLEFTILLLFRFAVPAEIPGYVVGLTRYPFAPYFLATFLSELPFAVMSVYASEAFLEKKYISVILLVVIGSLIIGIAFYFFRKFLRKSHIH